MNMDEHIKFWIESSEDDFQAMIHLSKKGHNTWALFIGHLVLEKLLKAWFIKKNSSNPPFIHDLKEFYNKCTNVFTQEWVQNISEFKTWINKKLQE